MSSFAQWRQARQWRHGHRPRAFGPPPQLFDTVVVLSPLVAYSGASVAAGTHGTVVDTHPTGSRHPVDYVVEIPLPGGGPVRFELAVAKPNQVVVGPPKQG